MSLCAPVRPEGFSFQEILIYLTLFSIRNPPVIFTVTPMFQFCKLSIIIPEKI